MHTALTFPTNTAQLEDRVRRASAHRLAKAVARSVADGPRSI